MYCRHQFLTILFDHLFGIHKFEALWMDFSMKCLWFYSSTLFKMLKSEIIFIFTLGYSFEYFVWLQYIDFSTFPFNILTLYVHVNADKSICIDSSPCYFMVSSRWFLSSQCSDILRKCIWTFFFFFLQVVMTLLHLYNI